MLDCEISCETSGGGKPPHVRGMEIVSGPGGRRRWTREAKARILAETLAPGANVAEVARRHGPIPQQLYGWRSAARARGMVSDFGFVSIALSDSGDRHVLGAGVGEIVVRAAGVTVHIPADVSTDHIERVLRATYASA